MSRVCPACGGLNADAERRCYRCGKRLPGPLTAWLPSFTSLAQGQLVATRGITLVCLVVFGLGVAIDGRFPLAPELGVGRGFRVSTLLRLGALFTPLVEPWRLLSAVFVHFSALHVGMNMWALLGFGRSLEERLGWARSFLIFVGAGVGGFVVSVWWYGDGQGLTAGASGGVFGQLGAVIGIVMTRKLPGWKELLVQNLVYALVLGLVLRVNTAAHLGGFGVGLLLGIAFERERPRPFSTRAFGVLALLAAVSSVGSVLASMTSPAWQFVRERELSIQD